MFRYGNMRAARYAVNKYLCLDLQNNMSAPFVQT